MLGVLLQGLEIEPVRQSQLVLVKFESPDPVLAARIANRVAEAFIQAEMDIRLQMTIGANAWLADRVEDLRRRLEQSEKNLADRREQANLVDSKSGSGGVAGQQLNDLQQKLVDASVKRAQAEQLYNQVKARRSRARRRYRRRDQPERIPGPGYPGRCAGPLFGCRRSIRRPASRVQGRRA